MNNIYTQKAKKYKYKYLKLKNNYIAQGGNYIAQGGNYIAQGGFGCIISPPYNFNFDDKQIIYQSPIDINIYNENYVGKLLNCYQLLSNKKYINSFYDEYKEFIELDRIDPNAKYRSKLVFAAYINNKQYLNINEKYKSKDNAFIFEECLKNKINKETTTDNQTITDKIKDNQAITITDTIKEDGKLYKFGYIISTKVGQSFDKIQLNQFDKEQIIQILTNLKESIQDLITTLYKQNLIHADIKFPNMTLDINNKFKVCFIDFGLMKNHKLNTDIEKLKNISEYYLYPEILYIYFYIKKIKQNTRITKFELIRLFYLNKNLKQILKKTKYNQTLFNKIKLNNIDYICFFKSLDDYNRYSLDEIYNICIEPIIKNIDIYGLSLFIYELFFNSEFNSNIFNQNQYKTQQNTIDAIINMLLINAIYNNIDGPEELIIYLDGIINCLNNKYKPGDIKNKIYERRTKQKKPYYNYYNNGYSEEWLEGTEKIIAYIPENELTINDRIKYEELQKEAQKYQKEAEIIIEEAEKYQKAAEKYQKAAQQIIENSSIYI